MWWYFDAIWKMNWVSKSLSSMWVYVFNHNMQTGFVYTLCKKLGWWCKCDCVRATLVTSMLGGGLEYQWHYLCCWVSAQVTHPIWFPQKHGLVVIPESTPNGDIVYEPMVGAIAVVTQETAQVLEAAGEGPLGKAELCVPPGNLLILTRSLAQQFTHELFHPTGSHWAWLLPDHVSCLLCFRC